MYELFIIFADRKFKEHIYIIHALQANQYLRFVGRVSFIPSRAQSDNSSKSRKTVATPYVSGLSEAGSV